MNDHIRISCAGIVRTASSSNGFGFHQLRREPFCDRSSVQQSVPRRNRHRLHRLPRNPRRRCRRLAPALQPDPLEEAAPHHAGMDRRLSPALHPVDAGEDAHHAEAGDERADRSRVAAAVTSAPPSGAVSGASASTPSAALSRPTSTPIAAQLVIPSVE
ncbi:MAG: hypothetical protein ACXWUX_02345 [Allosphingosinicella sp.]